jgi:hypothetical protein
MTQTLRGPINIVCINVAADQRRGRNTRGETADKLRTKATGANLNSTQVLQIITTITKIYEHTLKRCCFLFSLLIYFFIAK